MPSTSTAMKWVRAVTVALGVCGVAVLLWKFDWRIVAATVAHVGRGFLFLVALQVVALALNALGWKLSFKADEAPSYGLLNLARLWQAMDGINYFVPTGTLAGEIARTSMLPRVHQLQVRTSSVVVSRLGQTIAQLAFVLLGFALLVSRIPRLGPFAWMTTAATWLLAFVALGLLWYLGPGKRWIGKRHVPHSKEMSRIRATRNHAYHYLAAHPWRFVASIVVFTIAYAWLAIEGYWICRFINVPVSATIALTIEVLSVAIDGVLFFIPAKIGSQELGKTAIFSLLKLPLHAGFAFGVTRHAREVLWALAGFGIYSARKSRRMAAVPKRAPVEMGAPANLSAARVAREREERNR